MASVCCCTPLRTTGYCYGDAAAVRLHCPGETPTDKWVDAVTGETLTPAQVTTIRECNPR